MKSCKEITIELEELILNNNGESLPLEIKAHLEACILCENYFLDSKIIHNYLIKLLKEMNSESNTKDEKFIKKVMEKIESLN